MREPTRCSECGSFRDPCRCPKVLTLADLRCPETRKSAYVSKRRALAVIETAKKVPEWDYARHGGKPKRAYKCPHCGWWHITKQEERNGSASTDLR